MMDGMDAMDARATNTYPVLTPDSPEVRQIVDTIVAAVHPLRVLVFGSVARGTTGPNSDLDLLVIMPNGAHRRKTGQIIDRAICFAGGLQAVDVVVATAEDIEQYGNVPGLVYRDALADGREIYHAA